MPNYFRFRAKATRLKDKKPVGGDQIDLLVANEMLAKQYGVDYDPERWTFNWYNVIGEYMAMFGTFQKIREIYERGKPCPTDHDDLARWEKSMEVLNWFDDNFVLEAWYGPR